MINEISRTLPGMSTLRSVGEADGVAPLKEARTGESDSISTQKQQTGEQPGSVDGEQLNAIVEELNGFVQVVQRQLEFTVDQDNGEVIVKVVDAQTKDVVREIPAEEVREMRKRLSEVSEKLFPPDDKTAMLFQAKA